MIIYINRLFIRVFYGNIKDFLQGGEQRAGIAFLTA